MSRPRPEYWARRLRRHLFLATTATILVAIAAGLDRSPQVMHRLSIGTAYAALLLLAASLVIGPLRVLRDEPNPVSTDLTRDVGIWAGAISLLHVIFGLQVHMRGRFWLYFVYPPEQAHRLPLRHDSFGAANWTGLGATLVLLLLLAISNDVSLRRLGAKRWKALQRWSYAAALLTLAHGVLFQVIEKRRLPWILVFAAASAVTLLVQASGFVAVRRRAGKGA
jgi:methionine sulfoxide reductase heme-binding subunit